MNTRISQKFDRADRTVRTIYRAVESDHTTPAAAKSEGFLAYIVVSTYHDKVAKSYTTTVRPAFYHGDPATNAARQFLTYDAPERVQTTPAGRYSETAIVTTHDDFIRAYDAE